MVHAGESSRTALYVVRALRRRAAARRPGGVREGKVVANQGLEPRTHGL
jgi:hypothetical protein